MPPFSGPQGPFAGIAAGPDGTLYVSADGEGSVLALRRAGHMTVTPADHRYLQVARTLRKEIVDGVYPVGSQLPTEHELCERFAVSRYTVREALRRLRDDNLVVVAPARGHAWWCPAPATNSYAQDNMTINDLLAFASGAPFDDRVDAMVTIDAELAARTGLPRARSGWRCAAYRQADGAEYTPLLDRVLRQPRVRRRRQAAAAAHGPDLPAHRGPVRRERRRGAPGDRRGRRPPELADWLKVAAGSPPSRCTAHT